MSARKDLAIFVYKLPWYQVSSQGKKFEIYFHDGSHGGHLGFPIGTILDFFNLQVVPILPTKFRVNWPFGSVDEVQTDFQDDSLGGHFGFPI